MKSLNPRNVFVFFFGSSWLLDHRHGRFQSMRTEVIPISIFLYYYLSLVAINESCVDRNIWRLYPEIKMYDSYKQGLA
jgi:hypothetical protein